MLGAQEAVNHGGIQGVEKYLSKRLKDKYIKIILKMLQHLLGQGLEEGRPRTTGDFPLEIKGREMESKWVDIDSLVPMHPVDTGPIRGETKFGYIDHADALADQIKTKGFDLAFAIEVMLIEDGRYVIMEGHHHVEALRRLGCTQIPVVFEKGAMPEPPGVADKFEENYRKQIR